MHINMRGHSALHDCYNTTALYRADSRRVTVREEIETKIIPQTKTSLSTSKHTAHLIRQRVSQCVIQNCACHMCAHTNAGERTATKSMCLNFGQKPR